MAERLRTTRKHVPHEKSGFTEPIPSHLFDLESIWSAESRIQLTFATLSSFTISDPGQVFTGFISVLIVSVNIVDLIHKGRLFAMQCCGGSVSSNNLEAICFKCGQLIKLRLSPDIVEDIADETGAIRTVSPCKTDKELCTNPKNAPNTQKIRSQQNPSCVLFSDAAFTDLLGHPPNVLVEMCSPGLPPQTYNQNISRLRLLEQRMQWVRVTMLVGWTGEWSGGKLAILRVMK